MFLLSSGQRLVLHWISSLCDCLPKNKIQSYIIHIKHIKIWIHKKKTQYCPPINSAMMWNAVLWKCKAFCQIVSPPLHHWPPRGTAPGWEACAQSQEAIPPSPTVSPKPEQWQRWGVSVSLLRCKSMNSKEGFWNCNSKGEKLQTATLMLPFFNPKVKAVRLRV